MPTVFKQNVVTDIGTVPVDVLQIQEGVKATVVGCNLANNSGFNFITEKEICLIHQKRKLTTIEINKFLI